MTETEEKILLGTYWIKLLGKEEPITVRVFHDGPEVRQQVRGIMVRTIFGNKQWILYPWQAIESFSWEKNGDVLHP